MHEAAWRIKEIGQGIDMSELLQSILGAEALAAFETPGPVVSGLPAAAYTSEAFFALESERIFADSWIFVGLTHEMARPGDVVPVTVAGKPVLLVRDAEGAVRAFHNVCRHRCLTLVEEPCNVGPALQCPYHTWTYRLDGALYSTPYFGGSEPLSVPPGFDRTQYGLVPVRVGVWHDWIFVNLNGSAPPLDDYVAPIQNQLDGVDFSRMRHVLTVDFGEVNANWKLMMENFMEPYHVQFVHPTTTEQPLTDHYIVNEPGCLGCAVDVSSEAEHDDTLSADSRYLSLFPYFAIGIYLPDQVGVHLNTPVAPNRTRQRRAMYSLGGEAPWAENLEQLETLWRSVHQEDYDICERLQRGRESDVAAGGGLLSPVWEDAVRSFQERVVSHLR